MAPRIRSLKPEIWSDEALGTCPIGAKLLYIGLITQADDEGRFRAAPALIRGAIFPYETISVTRIAGWLGDLAGAGLIRLYQVSGEQYGAFPTWEKHQKIDRPTPSKIPPEPNTADSASVRRGLDGGSGREGKGSGKGSGPISSAGADTAEFDQIYERWTGQSALVRHQAPKQSMRRAAKRVLAEWSLEQVLEAIELYGTVIASEQHFFSYRWTLDDFLVRGLGKFAAEAQPLVRYLGPGPGVNGHGADAGRPGRDPAAARVRQVERCRQEYELRVAELGAGVAREDVLGMFSDEVVEEALGVVAGG